jgi:mRNA interferase MazF
MRRGDVVVIADRAGGDYVGKPRPAIIVQSDVFDGTESLVVCPLTTRQRDAQLLRVPLVPGSHLQLQETSWIMVDKLTSVRRDRVREVLGRPSDEEMLALTRSLAVFLGFA